MYLAAASTIDQSMDRSGSRFHFNPRTIFVSIGWLIHNKYVCYSFVCLTIFSMSCWLKYKEEKSRAVFFIHKEYLSICGPGKQDGGKFPIIFTSQSTSSYDCSCTSESFLFLDGNIYFFVFVAFLHAVVNWGCGCIRSFGVDDEVADSLSWWVLQLAVRAAILETAVSAVKCSSVSLKKKTVKHVIIR